MLGATHKLARFILDNLNWTEEAFVSPDLHTHVALVTCKKYTELKEATNGLWKWSTQWTQFLEFKDWLLAFLLNLSQFNSAG
jgi:hypothetical protein